MLLIYQTSRTLMAALDSAGALLIKDGVLQTRGPAGLYRATPAATAAPPGAPDDVGPEPASLAVWQAAHEAQDHQAGC